MRGAVAVLVLGVMLSVSGPARPIDAYRDVRRGLVSRYPDWMRASERPDFAKALNRVWPIVGEWTASYLNSHPGASAKELAAGVGQDKYESNADVNAAVNFSVFSGSRTPFNLSQNLTRTSYFGEASINLLLLRLTGEIGMVSGGSVPTFNKFDKPADNSRLYGSLGLTIDFPPF